MSERLSKILAQHQGPPVNVEAIVRDLGLLLDKKAELDPKIAGEIERLEDGRFKISANKTDHYYRQRFTIAHELAHYLKHRDLIGKGVDDNRAYRSTDIGKYHNQQIGASEETEANRIAAQLLMPAELVLVEWKEASTVETLAKRFQVSTAAMKIRLRTLGIPVE